MVQGYVKSKLKCYHCGEVCRDTNINKLEKIFCCEGCKTVYELLNESNMCDYYELETAPGNKANENNKLAYAYLEEEKIIRTLLNYKDENQSSVTLHIPSIHCSSCIWLLENLHKINAGIKSATIQFQQKQLDVVFNHTITLRQLVELLTSLGYAPTITLDGKVLSNQSGNKSIYYKLGIAGFCFGNIMMLSLPEYLSVFDEFTGDIKTLFTYLSLVLALPVLLYSASDYFTSAFNAVRNRMVNIDFPIAIGLSAAFLQSVYEIFSSTGSGYLDSLTGLIFFLLIGKWYQGKTYAALTFNRDFKSYFPLAGCKIVDGKECYLPLQDLQIGDEILVRNQEVIPADGFIVDGQAKIDYSFVTGEATPVAKNKSDVVLAGGRQVGAAIKIKVTRAVSESYLMQLWNKDSSKSTTSGLEVFTNNIGRYFTIAVLLISLGSYLYWVGKDATVAIHAAVSVLIIFCPCTLALAIPFCFAHAMQVMGKHGLYLKNTQTIEKLAASDTIVFDKTGTLTTNGAGELYFEGQLSTTEKQYVKSLVQHSTHPLSRAIGQYLHQETTVISDTFSEQIAQGIDGYVAGNHIKIGSAQFLGIKDNLIQNPTITAVYVGINGVVKGYFKFKNVYKPNMAGVLARLNKYFPLHLLSGDNDGERGFLSQFFPSQNLHFSQSPTDKLKYVAHLNQSKKVMMVGDGLNDAGALLQSHCGISIVAQSGSFSPACDAMLESASFAKLPEFIAYAKACLHRVYWSLGLSLLYNFTGLYFAVQGDLKPLVAAILMPLSSLSVVLFVTIFAPKFTEKVVE